jgi:hypothetical protein
MPLALILSLVVACGDKDESADYVQVNADDDVITVDVGAADVLEARTVELRSNTGAVVIGLGEVSPGGGPIGTRRGHRLWRTQGPAMVGRSGPGARTPCESGRAVGARDEVP